MTTRWNHAKKISARVANELVLNFRNELFFVFFLIDHNWSDTASEKDGNSAPATPGFAAITNQKALVRTLPIDPQSGSHEYHEISDEEVGESPAFDLGPSLMDEVLKALGGGGSSGHTSSTAAGTAGKPII